MQIPTRSLLPCAGLAATLALLLGCASDSTPTAPTAATEPVLDPAIAIGQTGDLATGLATLGLYDFQLDPASRTFELTPARAATAIGDAFTIDLTTAFTTTKFGCADCLDVKTVEYDTSGAEPVFQVLFRATHPFGAFPTASNRADLHVNNARLVFLVNGDDSFFGGAVTGDTKLMVAPDGFVTLPSTFVTKPGGITSTLFPFRVFQTGNNLSNPTGNFDINSGWTGNLGTPTGYNVLPMGGSAEAAVDFIIEPSDTAVVAGKIVLLANFVASATFDTRPNPTYYMPEGAMPEAWHVEVLPPAGLTDEATDQPGGVGVAVVDWQAGATVDPAFPNASNPRGLKTSGAVADVSVSVPAFGAPPAPVTTPESGAGTLADPYRYVVFVTKPASLTTAGTYMGLAKVRDVRTPFNALDQSLDVATGLSSLTELATYQAFEIVVEEGMTGGYTPPVLGAAMPFGPSQVTNDQTSGTNLFPDGVSQIMDSYNDTVVMLLKKQASDFKSFAVASADGGTTWGTPIPLDPEATGGGATSVRNLSVAVSADGTFAYVITSEFSGGDSLVSRLNIAGNALTLDANVRAVNLSTLIGPTSTTYEAVIVRDPVDPEVFYVGGDDADGTVGTLRFMMGKLANAKSATGPGGLLLTGLGGSANGVAYTTDPSVTGIFDACMAYGPDGDVYVTFDPARAMADPGIFIHWDKQSNTFSTPVVFDNLVDPVFGDFALSRVKVGPDSKPVIAFTETIADNVMIMKAQTAGAPWNFTTPVLVDPDFDKVVQGNQLGCDLAVDETTGRIHVTLGDYRDAPTESSETPLLVSLFETIYDPDLTMLVDGRKLDDPGTGDNSDGDRAVRVFILQSGAPTTKKWFYFWQDADAKNPAVGPDVLMKIGL